MKKGEVKNPICNIIPVKETVVVARFAFPADVVNIRECLMYTSIKADKKVIDLIADYMQKCCDKLGISNDCHISYFASDVYVIRSKKFKTYVEIREPNVHTKYKVVDLSIKTTFVVDYASEIIMGDEPDDIFMPNYGIEVIDNNLITWDMLNKTK